MCYNDGMKTKEKKICKVEGCGREDIKAKGYCTKHWQRIKRNGTTELIIEYGGPRKDYPREYKTWDGMRQRCLQPSCPLYKNYGGRGIKICDRWQGAHGFANFIEDMGPKPGSKYSIDRIDVNGDYEPSNCRWATYAQQACNKRNNSPAPGVNWYPRTNRWVVRYRANGKELKRYIKSYEEAVAQRKEWEEKYSSE